MDDPSLFGDDPAPAPAISHAPKSAEKWQTDLIRRALDTHGLTTQETRRGKIMEITRRDLAGLADLTTHEAAKVLSALGRNRTEARPAGSSWDSREEDTWIDRL